MESVKFTWLLDTVTQTGGISKVTWLLDTVTQTRALAVRHSCADKSTWLSDTVAQTGRISKVHLAVRHSSTNKIPGCHSSTDKSKGGRLEAGIHPRDHS